MSAPFQALDYLTICIRLSLPAKDRGQALFTYSAFDLFDINCPNTNHIHVLVGHLK